MLDRYTSCLSDVSPARGCRMYALVLAVGLLAISNDQVVLDGAPKQETPRLKVTFRNGNDPVDKLRSDSYGASYQDGVDGTMQIMNGKIWAQFVSRRFQAWLPERYNVMDVPGWPYFSSDGGLLYIDDVATMVYGDRKPALATFNVDGNVSRPPRPTRTFKRYRWCGSNCPELSAQMVLVERTVVDRYSYPLIPRWIITSDPTVGFPEVGYQALLQEEAKSKFVNTGPYPMPFQITVDCIARCDLVP